MTPVRDRFVQELGARERNRTTSKIMTVSNRDVLGKALPDKMD